MASISLGIGGTYLGWLSRPHFKSIPAAGASWLARTPMDELVQGRRAVTADANLRLARYFGMSEGFFLGLQAHYDLMNRKREIATELNAIRPRAA